MKHSAFRLTPFITALGLLLSAVGGIMVGFRAFLYPGTFPRYPNDWNWLIFYAGLLISAFVLARIWRGRLLLAACAALALLALAVSTLQAGLVKELVAWVWFVLLAASLGDFLLVKLIGLPNLNTFDRIVLGTALGFGGLMVLGFLLGIAGGYTQTSTLILLGILSAAAIPRWVRGIIRGFSNRWDKFITAWKSTDLRGLSLAIAVLLIFLLGPYLWASAPAIRWDSLSYHVAVPQIYIAHQAMVEIPESAQTYWAHYAEMLYTLGMLVAGQPLPGWFHLTMGGLAAATAVSLGRALVNWRTGILAGLLIITLPLVNFEIGSAYMDGFTMAYITAMLFTGLLWLRQNSSGYLALAGIFAGIAAGLKLNALPFIAVFGAALFIFILRQKPFSFARIGQILFFLVPFLLLWVPWLARDAVWTGNPIFPNYNSIFKSDQWPQSDVFAVKEISGNSLLRWVRAPLDLVLHSDQFYREAPGGVLLALPWLALPWGYLTAKSMYPRRPYWLALIAFSVSSTLLVSLISWNLRYLFPLYPVMALLAAANFEILFQQGRSLTVKWPAVVAGSLLAAAYLLAGQASILVRMPDIPERYPFPLAIGTETQTEFKSRTLPFLPAFEYLNQQPGEVKVLSLGIEFRLDTRANIYAPLFSAEAKRLLHDYPTEADLIQALREYGYDFILVYVPEQQFRPEVYTSPALSPGFYSQYARLVFEQNQVYLYALDGSQTGE